MSTENLFAFALILTVLLCTLVAGFLFAFAIVTMPGIKRLNDREFVRAFQVMDGVIQNNQPLFVLVWAGSVLTLVISTGLGFGQLDDTELVIMLAAATIYLFGVQLPTLAVNVPLNNELQTVDTRVVDEAGLRDARQRFEPRWNQWNVFRTMLATLASTLFMILLFIA